MNILLVSPLPPPMGGMATWTRQFTNYLTDQGINYSVINTSLNVNRIGARYSVSSEWNRLLGIISDARRFQSQSFSTIHINSSGSVFGLIRDMYLMCKFRKITNRLIEFHCDLAAHTSSRIYRFFLRKYVKLGTKILVLNRQSELILKEFDVNLTIQRTSNFLDIKEMNACFDKADRKILKNVLFVGHINRNKGIDELIRVAKFFPDKVFHCAGRQTEKFENNYFPPNIILYGEIAVKELNSLYSNSDMFLFLSHTEGFPLVILEAMYHSLPVIATAVGAVPDILESTMNILVNIGDIDAVISSIKLLETSGDLAKIGRENQQRVTAKYSLDHVAERLVYENYR